MGWILAWIFNDFHVANVPKSIIHVVDFVDFGWIIRLGFHVAEHTCMKESTRVWICRSARSKANLPGLEDRKRQVGFWWIWVFKQKRHSVVWDNAVLVVLVVVVVVVDIVDFLPNKIKQLAMYIGVSGNGCTPKSSILIGFSIINHPFWGIPIFGNQQSHIPNAGSSVGFQQLWQIADDIKNNLDEAKLLQAELLGSHLEHGETTGKKPKQPIVWGYCWCWWLEQGETIEKMRKRGVAFPLLK